MAVLGGIKNMFSRKEKSKDFNPLNTTWIMDKMITFTQNVFLNIPNYIS